MPTAGPLGLEAHAYACDRAEVIAPRVPPPEDHVTKHARIHESLDAPKGPTRSGDHERDTMSSHGMGELLATPDDPCSVSGKKLGRYEVLTKLASGGMASVYVARAQGAAGFERLVAIKVLHPHLAHDHEFISMFLDEARLAARIRHPNVVPTLDISSSRDDGYFLVMEYVEGDHLAAILGVAADSGVPVPPPIVLRMVVDALEGLGAAHALKDHRGRPLALVHRDVSPHNILVGMDGAARITDFGIAKADVRLASTRTGQFKGKLAYMAPEHASSGTTDHRSDLFCMGIILWEALTSRSLFRANNAGELLNRLLNLPIPLPSVHRSELAPLDLVLRRALSRVPSGRFRSASEFVDAIETAAPSLGGIASPRQVGVAMRTWLAAKVEADAERIGRSIDSLGRSELPPGSDVPRIDERAARPSRPVRSHDDTMVGVAPCLRDATRSRVSVTEEVVLRRGSGDSTPDERVEPYEQLAPPPGRASGTTARHGTFEPPSEVAKEQRGAPRCSTDEGLEPPCGSSASSVAATASAPRGSSFPTARYGGVSGEPQRDDVPRPPVGLNDTSRGPSPRVLPRIPTRAVVGTPKRPRGLFPAVATLGVEASTSAKATDTDLVAVSAPIDDLPSNDRALRPRSGVRAGTAVLLAIIAVLLAAALVSSR